MTHSQGRVFGTSGMWDRVARLVVPDVSQDCSVFIFKVLYSNKKSSFTPWPFEREGTKSIEMSVTANPATQHPIPESQSAQCHSCSPVYLCSCLCPIRHSWARGLTYTRVVPWLPPHSYCLPLQRVRPAVVLLVWWVGLSPLLVGVCILQHASGHCWCCCGYWSPGA